MSFTSTTTSKRWKHPRLFSQTAPYALESTDKMILNLARGNIVQSQRLGFVQGNPSSLLMVEYAGETEDEVKEQVDKLEELRKRERIGYAATLAFKPEEVKAIWGVRKAGLGLLLGTRVTRNPSPSSRTLRSRRPSCRNLFGDFAKLSRATTRSPVITATARWGACIFVR